MKGPWPDLVAQFLPVIVLAVVVLSTYPLSFLSGWRTLAKRYPATDDVVGEYFRWRSARVGWARYDYAVTFCVSPRGLRVSLFGPFRLGHAPFFVPWEDVTIQTSRGPFNHYTRLHFRRALGPYLDISPRLATRLANASNGAFVVPER